MGLIIKKLDVNNMNENESMSLDEMYVKSYT